MSISSDLTVAALSAAAQAAPAWQNAGATVRFVLAEPDTEVTLDPQGQATDAAPTHVLRISWSDLLDITAGRRSFLRSVTGRRLSSHGPVMQTFAFGQALETFGLGR
ncbi:hypothetical protein [Streptomyces sp. CBMA123]|uniref:hypothetical protein n=1 Tax=Streptomyces sp. CBMA123 TaxID=1896313 RepID=UPI0016621A2A|nr:hypothetical protein [Streptomyces sp. CBMA123]MBD0690659.1 hypothetical protein [Streptomyces sp. CBMA123]